MSDAIVDYRFFLDQNVVLDTRTTMVFLGTLIEVSEHFLTLKDADIHDARESTSTNEIYVMECGRNGISPNRKFIKVKQAEVISLSRLEDVVIY